MASRDSPDEVLVPHAHEEPELRAVSPNGFATRSTETYPDLTDKLNVGAKKPRSKPKAKPPVNAPKDCPILTGKQPLPILPQKSITSTSWFWPLMFAILGGALTAGIWAGRISTQDDGRSIVIGELKANDAALAARIEAVSTDRGRDSERLARLEVTVQSIDKNIQALIDVSRPKTSRRD